MRICFLVGSVDISGGTYVIFQHAAFLRAVGHEVVLAVQQPFTKATSTWHPGAGSLQMVPFDAATDNYDWVIATWWKTALELHRFKAKNYAYFVQSIESRFYPETEGPLKRLVDSTYDLPVAYVTEAHWILEHLRKYHGQSATLVRNGIRKDLYVPLGLHTELRPNGKLRILVEGPFDVFFKNTGKALNIAKRSQAGEVWLLTHSPVSKLPGVNRVFSRLPITAVPDIYRSCDVLLKLSYVEGMFGPPLEMFHCGGTAITYNVTGHDEYIVHNNNALVAERDDDIRVIRYLHMLQRDPELLARLKYHALVTADNWPDWDESSSAFFQWTETATSNCDAGALATQIKAAWDAYVPDENARLANVRTPSRALSKFRSIGRQLVPEKLQWLKYLPEYYF
jgi:O-antigen biosynthesis protein